MSNFRITPEEMNRIAKELEKKIEEWNAAVKNIYSTYSELNTQFEGEAKSRFDQLMATDQPKYNSLSQVMTEYINTIVKASSKYVSADKDAATVIKQ